MPMTVEELIGRLDEFGGHVEVYVEAVDRMQEGDAARVDDVDYDGMKGEVCIYVTKEAEDE